jgi:PAS domain-containing protein
MVSGSPLTPGEDHTTGAQQAPGQASEREQVSVGVVLCDAAGNVLHVDDAAAAIMGFDGQTTAAVRLQTWPEFENSLLDGESAFAGLLEESAMRLAKLMGDGGFGKK